MTIQWMLIAAFLYFELGMIALLSLSFISPKLWYSLFHFHVWKLIVKKANIYFNILIFILLLFFLDSIRDMTNYSTKVHSQLEMDAELQLNVKLFRSQRNYYISGFTLFLWLVLRKLVILISKEAELITRNEEAAKKAQDATEFLEKLRKSTKEISASTDVISLNAKKLKELEEQLNSKNHELSSVNQMLSNYKENACSVQKEYEELLQTHKALKDGCSSEIPEEVDS